MSEPLVGLMSASAAVAGCLRMRERTAGESSRHYAADPKPPAGITETCRYNMYSAAPCRYSAEEQAGSGETSTTSAEISDVSMRFWV